MCVQALSACHQSTAMPHKPSRQQRLARITLRLLQRSLRRQLKRVEGMT